MRVADPEVSFGSADTGGFLNAAAVAQMVRHPVNMVRETAMSGRFPAFRGADGEWWFTYGSVVAHLLLDQLQRGKDRPVRG